MSAIGQTVERSFALTSSPAHLLIWSSEFICKNNAHHC